MGKVVTLSCGCKFHGQCIVEHMQRGVCNCPNCRLYHPKFHGITTHDYTNNAVIMMDDQYDEEDEEDEEDEPGGRRHSRRARRHSICMPNFLLLLKRLRSKKKSKKASHLLELYNKHARKHRDAKKERRRLHTIYYGMVNMLKQKSREDIKKIHEDLKVSLRSLRKSGIHKELVDKNRVCSSIGYRCRILRGRIVNFEK